MTYKVKLGVAVYHEVVVDIDAENAASAMDIALDQYDKNLLPPVREIRNTPAAIIAVSKKP